MVDGAGGAQRQSFMRYLIVPNCFCVGVEKNVGVALDETGKNGGIRKFDDLCASQIDAGGRSRCLNAIAGDADCPTFMHSLAIKNSGRLQNDACLSTCLSQPE
jgi:hypothetical protein